MSGSWALSQFKIDFVRTLIELALNVPNFISGIMACTILAMPIEIHAARKALFVCSGFANFGLEIIEIAQLFALPALRF